MRSSRVTLSRYRHGTQFTLAEYLAGLVMIVLMMSMLRLLVSRSIEARARRNALQAERGHYHHHAGERMPWRARLTSVRAWSDVAHNFRGDWQMLWKEIAGGLLLAGFVAQLGNGFFEHLFVHNAPAPLPALQNVVVGPAIAVISFVCSVGNVPLAAVLWSGGISFAGVLAFLLADLVVVPILLVYRKYYGATFTVRITTLMLVTIVIAALIVYAVFSVCGLVPTGPRPARADIFGPVTVNYKLALNVLGLVIFATLFWLTVRHGATDPVCGMKVDREKAVRLRLGVETHYFCSEHCMQVYRRAAGAGEHRSLGAAGCRAEG